MGLRGTGDGAVGVMHTYRLIRGGTWCARPRRRRSPGSSKSPVPLVVSLRKEAAPQADAQTRLRNMLGRILSPVGILQELYGSRDSRALDCEPLLSHSFEEDVFDGALVEGYLHVDMTKSVGK